jgi:hypothetical protein
MFSFKTAKEEPSVPTVDFKVFMDVNFPSPGPAPKTTGLSSLKVYAALARVSKQNEYVPPERSAPWDISRPPPLSDRYPSFEKQPAHLERGPSYVYEPFAYNAEY